MRDNTYVCIASGPSLSNEQLDLVDRYRNKIKGIIGVNRAFEAYQKFDILFGADKKFWLHYYDVVKSMPFIKTTIEGNACNSRIREIPFEFANGLGDNCIHHNGNSGLMAINLAYLLGAKNIILIGYDFKHSDSGKVHFHSDYDKKKFQSNFEITKRLFDNVELIANDLRERSVRIVNCSIDTAIECIDKQTLHSELELLC